MNNWFTHPTKIWQCIVIILIIAVITSVPLFFTMGGENTQTMALAVVVGNLLALALVYRILKKSKTNITPIFRMAHGGDRKYLIFTLIFVLLCSCGKSHNNDSVSVSEENLYGISPGMSREKALHNLRMLDAVFGYSEPGDLGTEYVYKLGKHTELFVTFDTISKEVVRIYSFSQYPIDKFFEEADFQQSLLSNDFVREDHEDFFDEEDGGGLSSRTTVFENKNTKDKLTLDCDFTNLYYKCLTNEMLENRAQKRMSELNR